MFSHRLLPGAQGHEDRLTHLIVGEERRTLKVLLAVANGAHILAPTWLTASLEAVSRQRGPWAGANPEPRDGPRAEPGQLVPASSSAGRLSCTVHALTARRPLLCRASQGRWLPESEFAAPVRFATTAAAVRAAMQQPEGTPADANAKLRPRPLAGRLVFVQVVSTRGGGSGGGSGSGSGLGGTTAAHRAAIQRLVRALGGRVCGARAAAMCVACGNGGGRGGGGGGARPKELPPAARVVGEEWLLRLAETHEPAE
jgi:hypothetical protein